VKTGCWVYILLSEKDSSRYVGISSQLERRLRAHNRGKNRSTASGRPWHLVHKELFPDHSSAREREKWFKSAAGRRWLSETFASP